MRRTYLDVMRGVAVLVMIEAHTFDAWTRDADRGSNAFGYTLILGGFGAPLFLFLAGVAVPMSAGSKLRKLDDRARAAAAVQRRGWEIFALAFLFRLQAFVLGGSTQVSDLLKVDILNIMGPSIVAAALVWNLCRSTRSQLLAFTAIAAAIAMTTPIVRAMSWLGPLPDVIEAYVRPVPGGRSNFTGFPWIAFVFAGAVVGSAIDAARTARDETRVNVALAAAGALLVAAGFTASYMPSIYERSNFWTSSPTFFAMRVGILALAIALTYGWQRRFTLAATKRLRPARGGGANRRAAAAPSASAWGWGPTRSENWLSVFGRASLFVYWIHVEMVYGLVARPIQRQLALPVTLVAYALFTLLLYWIVRIKNAIVGRREAARVHVQVGT